MDPTAPPIDPTWAAQNKATSVIVVMSIFNGLSFVFTSMRLYTRGVIKGKLHLDDYFILISLVSVLLSVSIVSFSLTHIIISAYSVLMRLTSSRSVHCFP